MLQLRQPPLYVKLYLWFLGIVLVLGAISSVLVFALGRGGLRPPRPTYGMRMLQHLARALAGTADANALREAVEGAHEDLELDVAVLDAQLQPRAVSGQPMVLPPETHSRPVFLPRDQAPRQSRVSRSDTGAPRTCSSKRTPRLSAWPLRGKLLLSSRS